MALIHTSSQICLNYSDQLSQTLKQKNIGMLCRYIEEKLYWSSRVDLLMMLSHISN